MATQPVNAFWSQMYRGLDDEDDEQGVTMQAGAAPAAPAAPQAPGQTTRPAQPALGAPPRPGQTRPQQPASGFFPPTRPTRPAQPMGGGTEVPPRPQQPAGPDLGTTPGPQPQQPAGRTFTYFGAQYAGDNPFTELYDKQVAKPGDPNGGGWRMPLYKAAQNSGVNIEGNIEGHGNIGEAILFGQFDPFMKDGKLVLVNTGNPNEMYDAQTGRRMRGQSAVGSAVGAGGGSAGGGGSTGGGPGGGPSTGSEAGEPVDFESEIERMILQSMGGEDSNGLDATIEDFVRRGMTGEDSPFGAEQVARLKGAAMDETAGQVQAANRMANLQAQRTGNLYSGSTAETLAENQRAADEAVGGQNRAIDSQATVANFEARRGALDKAMGLQAQRDARKVAQLDGALKLLGQRMERELANARNDIERARIKDQFTIAMEQVSAQREVARQESSDRRAALEAQREAAENSARSELASGRAWREHELSKLNLQRDWETEDWMRELPFRFGE